MTQTELASVIDQTLLSPVATEEQAEGFCREAAGYGFASVCVNPCFVPLAARLMQGTATKVCTVIDFPLGAGGRESKLRQADAALSQGARELDFVVGLALVKAHQWARLEEELRPLADKVRGAGGLSKLIIETCCLSDDEIVGACRAAAAASFDFVKTSTGFSTGGATVHAVSLMRRTVGQGMGVKASGGIHTAAQALDLLAAGASRLGTSSGVQIVRGLEGR